MKNGKNTLLLFFMGLMTVNFLSEAYFDKTMGKFMKIMGIPNFESEKEIFVMLMVLGFFLIPWLFKRLHIVIGLLVVLPMTVMGFIEIAKVMDYKLSAMELWMIRGLAISTTSFIIFWGREILSFLLSKILMALMIPFIILRRAIDPVLALFRRPRTCPLDIGIYEIDNFSGDTSERGRKFEDFVAQMYRVLGYDAQTTGELRRRGLLPEGIQKRGGSGEQGVDVIMNIPDEKTGEIQKVLIQCKLYSSKVSNSAIQEINTALNLYGGHKAVVITNNYFTQPALELGLANNVTMIDRDALIELKNKAVKEFYRQEDIRLRRPKRALI